MRCLITFRYVSQAHTIKRTVLRPGSQQQCVDKSSHDGHKHKQPGQLHTDLDAFVHPSMLYDHDKLISDGRVNNNNNNNNNNNIHTCMADMMSRSSQLNINNIIMSRPVTIK